jgi:hypothetical protein
VLFPGLHLQTPHFNHIFSLTLFVAGILGTLHRDLERQFVHHVFKQVVDVRISGMGVVTRRFHRIVPILAILVGSEATADSRFQSLLAAPANLLHPSRPAFTESLDWRKKL